MRKVGVAGEIIGEEAGHEEFPCTRSIFFFAPESTEKIECGYMKSPTHRHQKAEYPTTKIIACKIIRFMRKLKYMISLCNRI